MKFINKRTGVILEPRSRMVEDQLRKSTEYAPYEPQKAADEGEKPLAKMNKAELLETAQAAVRWQSQNANAALLVTALCSKLRAAAGK